MLLYHYATKKFNPLLTKEKQNLVKPDERKQEEERYVKQAKRYGYKTPGYYFEHISFFFDPVPLDILANIFPKDHPVWHSGSELYQHVVETDEIGHFLYEIVESPEKTELWYKDISDQEYFKKLKQAVVSKNYIGNQTQFEEAARDFVGTTRQFYEQLKDRPNYDEIKYKYAATIPHVMLYPYLGSIKPNNITKVKVV